MCSSCNMQIKCYICVVVFSVPELITKGTLHILKSWHTLITMCHGLLFFYFFLFKRTTVVPWERLQYIVSPQEFAANQTTHLLCWRKINDTSYYFTQWLPLTASVSLLKVSWKKRGEKICERVVIFRKSLVPRKNNM